MTAPAALADLLIRSGQGDYRVQFVPGVAAALDAALGEAGTVLIVDRKVAALCAGALGPWMAARPTLLLDATEEEKSLAGVARIAGFFQQHGCTRGSVAVAVGGGIVQDLVCFAAHLWHRGLKWVFVPTTLLAMADSCIGAKCGINFNHFKNQLGFFYAPSRVVSCAEFLGTLEERDVGSGFGEILKLAITGGEELLGDLERTVARDGLRGPETLRLVRQSLVVKQGVIEEDEYERDLRRILNYGHTFGHALESISDNAVPHGLAVAWGLDLANYLSVRRGLLAPEGFERVHAFIERHLPFALREPVVPDRLLAAARTDKKASAGQVNLILLARIGELKIVRTPLDAELAGQLAAWLADRPVFAARRS